MSQLKRKIIPGQVIPVRLPVDEDEAEPYIRILEKQKNRNQYLLELINKDGKSDSIFPGGTIGIQLPIEMTYKELDWISTHLPRLSEEFMNMVRGRMRTKPALEMVAGEDVVSTIPVEPLTSSKEAPILPTQLSDIPVEIRPSRRNRNESF
ncbi:hypothetical protein [Paenibacillus agricola]|uniref:Uncharacterized protein n=1 Tax=Paenibacillus agricola TaxID=2716264 RepID=A0ABX0JJG3_9BACL|nr:hypothetical protein [Paenibacillus agricola]NHN35584.1 hypothetical protein [Paenibacillus agricola]